jgi:hypothetical protein
METAGDSSGSVPKPIIIQQKGDCEFHVQLNEAENKSQLQTFLVSRARIADIMPKRKASTEIRGPQPNDSNEILSIPADQLPLLEIVLRAAHGQNISRPETDAWPAILSLVKFSESNNCTRPVKAQALKWLKSLIWKLQSGQSPQYQYAAAVTLSIYKVLGQNTAFYALIDNLAVNISLPLARSENQSLGAPSMICKNDWEGDPLKGAAPVLIGKVLVTALLM